MPTESQAASQGQRAAQARPIYGVVNEATRQRIKHWRREGWRCPVVIQARTGGDGFADVYSGSEMADGARAWNLFSFLIMSLVVASTSGFKKAGSLPPNDRDFSSRLRAGQGRLVLRGGRQSFGPRPSDLRSTKTRIRIAFV